MPIVPATIGWDTVSKLALALPDVEERRTTRGITLTVKRKMLARSAIHKSAEPHSLMVRTVRSERAALIAKHHLRTLESILSNAWQAAEES